MYFISILYIVILYIYTMSFFLKPVPPAALIFGAHRPASSSIIAGQAAGSLTNGQALERWPSGLAFMRVSGGLQ